MTHETTRDLDLDLWGAVYTVPQGTEVELVEGADGVKGDLWAVKDVAFLVELTGNAHDPKYRYAFVPGDAVAERAAAAKP